jgi:deoxyinosine 3'endonuclease (endonuclease V)
MRQARRATLVASEMIAFTDVHYRDTDATAACVVADGFDAEAPTDEWTARISPIAPYEPGAFFKRELPCADAHARRHRWVRLPRRAPSAGPRRAAA